MLCSLGLAPVKTVPIIHFCLVLLFLILLHIFFSPTPPKICSLTFCSEKAKSENIFAQSFPGIPVPTAEIKFHLAVST